MKKLVTALELASASLIDSATISANNPKAWKTIPTPLAWSTAACLKGSLLAVGGQDSNGKDSASVHLLKSDGQTWERMEGGDMPMSCQRPTVVCSPSGELLLVHVGMYLQQQNWPGAHANRAARRKISAAHFGRMKEKTCLHVVAHS